MFVTRIAIAQMLVLLGSYAYAQAEPVEYRLPPEIQPTSQSIELKLDPGVADYSGSTVIQIDIAGDVEQIGIYQIDLELHEIVLKSGAVTRTLRAVSDEYDVNWLSDGAVIAAGQYELHIEFSGQYSTDSLGMHRVSFEDNDYIFTQMESMYFRRAVPGFDEPSFKFPYELTITAPEGLTVVANAPVASESTSDGWQRVEFVPTKPQSSYLVAYAVGPLDRVEIPGLSVPGYLYTPKGYADEAGFVLRHTSAIFEGLEEYFGIDYPFDKLDFLAVPDFAFGAMENPGLVTYRTDLLLLGDEVSGRTAAIALMVISHELAHMWFGDLVTMAWWDDLWLNEAFASWMAGKMMQRLFPQYEFDLDLPQLRAYGSDQRTGAKAIRRERRTDSDVTEDAGLAYSKGETLLMMLEDYVGEDAWQAGVRQYMKEFAWRNATESDLWRVISQVSGTDVSKIAGSFLNQPGFPILTIDKNGAISQQRYLAHGLEAPDLQWTIPLNVKYKKDDKVSEVFYLLDDKTGTIDLPKGADWILPDGGATGYFRWETDTDQLYALADDIALLESREKIAFLDNADALLEARSLSLEDYMFVMSKMLDDSHPLVVLPTVEKVKTIGDQYVDSSNAAAFARFVDESLGERFADVGIETRAGDSEALIQLRPRLVRVLGQYGSDPAVRASATEKADLYLQSPGKVHSNLAIEALRVSALGDDGGRYRKYIDTYKKSAIVDQKSNILSALYFQQPENIVAALDFSISDDVAAGDSVQVIRFYADILDDQGVLYTWLESNIDALEAKIPAYYHALMPQVMIGRCSDRNIELMTDFFAERGEKYASSLGKALETTATCNARRKYYGPALAEFLASYSN